MKELISSLDILRLVIDAFLFLSGMLLGADIAVKMEREHVRKQHEGAQQEPNPVDGCFALGVGLWIGLLIVMGLLVWLGLRIASSSPAFLLP